MLSVGNRRILIVFTTFLILFVVFAGGAVATTNIITNGTFSSGLDNWSTNTTQPDGCSSSIQSSNNMAYIAVGTQVWGSRPTATISQNVNFTYLDTISFDLRLVDYAQKTGSYSLTPSSTPIGAVKLGSNTVKTIYLSDIVGYTSTSNTLSADVSQYSGYWNLTFEFYMDCYVNGLYYGVALYLDNVTGYVLSPVTVSSISVSPVSPNAGAEATVTVTYSGGDTPTGTLQSYVVVDGTSYDVYNNPSPITLTKTYSSAGTYTLSAYGSAGGSTSTTRSTSVTVLPPLPSGITVEPSSQTIHVNTAITFVASTGSGSGSVTSWGWDFDGDGTVDDTTTSPTTSHTYTTTGTYSMAITATGPGGSVTVQNVSTITVGDTAITLDNPHSNNSYILTQDSTIQATYTITPYTTGYTMELWLLYDDYSTKERKASQNISSASGTINFQIDETTTPVGNYRIFLVKDGTDETYVTFQIQYPTPVITVRLTANNYLLSSTATVNLKDGSDNIIQTKTTSNGVAYFYPVTGATISLNTTYTIAASASGYSDASQAITPSTSQTTVTLNMSNGTTSTGSSGYGGSYEPTVASWIVTDEWGLPLSGVTVALSNGVQGFDDSNVIQNIFNFISGDSNFAETTQTNTTDSQGLVTFVVVPSYTYQLTFTYGSTTTTKRYSIGTIQPTYTLTLKTGAAENDLNRIISTSATKNQSEGEIVVKYTDSTNRTTSLSIVVKDSEGNIIPNGQWTSATNNTEQTFSVGDGYYNADFTVTITSSVLLDGVATPYTKTYDIHFDGPRLDIGIPADLLIWIALFSTLAIGGLFTRFSVTTGGIAVCLWMWLMYGIGWLYAMTDKIGDAGVIAILIFATLFAFFFKFAEGSR